MTVNDSNHTDVLLRLEDIQIEGFSDEKWHPIIRGVDLTLRRGEVMGLVGESGSGKTTLGLASMGFTRAGCRLSAGTVIFDNMDLSAIPVPERRKLWGTRIAYVAQSAAASFNPARRVIDQTIEATLRRGLTNRQTIEQDARVLFASLQLPDPENIGERYPHQVSGGQLQRMMTAMAMSPRPDLIIFDEPTTALDVTTQVEVLIAVRNLVEQHNTAAIYITHDLAVVAQMADLVMVLRYGKEVEQAETRQIIKAPEEDYTKTLWSVRALEKEQVRTEDIVLSIENVDAAYNQTIKVLQDISISIPRGRTVSIVGESGSGKSTVARVITGLLPPSTGRVRFNNDDLPASTKLRSVDQKKRIQMIYQMADTAMNPKQTVFEIIGRPLEFYHGMRGQQKRERVQELLNMIELEDRFANRFPSELSGGQKQRICIARALAAQPELIICDEVTSALDQIVQEGILRLLLNLQETYNITYLFITHDIAVVKAISDEIVVMYQGRVVEQGMKDDVLSPPHPDYTQLLLESVPEMDPDWLTNLVKNK